MANQSAPQHSWRSMLRTTRAAISILVFGGAALTLPPQTRDMLAFLDGASIGSAIAFQASLFVLAMSGWYWSRAALAARFGIDDSMTSPPPGSNIDWSAYKYLPRLILGVGFAVGALLAVKNGGLWTTLGAIVIGVVGLCLAVYRRRVRSGGPPPPRLTTIDAWIHGGAWERARAIFKRAPFGTKFAIALIVVDLSPLYLGEVNAYISSLDLAGRVSAVFPGPAIVLLLLGMMIGPMVTATFILDGLPIKAPARLQWLLPRRPPVMSLGIVYIFIFVPLIFHIHTVRIIEKPLAPQRSLTEVFNQWVEACTPKSGPIKPIIVAVSGGATRAGLWGAAVIDQVLQAQKQDGPALFAVSSVSGGSLGVAGAMTLLSQEGLPCRATGLPALRGATADPVPLAGDALGPLLGGWLLNDIPRSFVAPGVAILRWLSSTRPNGGDSAEAIEHGFERLWGKAKPNGTLEWDQPFLSLFYTDGAGSYRRGMPLWLANGTDATTGNRIITTPIAVPDIDQNKLPDSDKNKLPWPFRGARDFHALMGADASISTVINNTARFPYLEPFGEMLPLTGSDQVGSLVDGGYFENEGLQTALELAHWLEEPGRAGNRLVQPIIVQATGDGEADVGASDIMTCDNASDGAPIPDTKHSAWQIFAPLAGLYHVRGGHSAVLLRQAHDEFCPDRDHYRFAHFYLPAYNGPDVIPPSKGTDVPLNWVLSTKTGQFIWGAFTDGQVKNFSELQNLKKMLAPQAADQAQ